MFGYFPMSCVWGFDDIGVMVRYVRMQHSCTW
jgi:hypothetical protein